MLKDNIQNLKKIFEENKDLTNKNLIWIFLLKKYILEKNKNFHYILNDYNFILLDNTNFNIKTKIENNLNILKNLDYTEIGIIYEYFLSLVNKENKKNKGQFYTPEDISSFMASKIIEFKNYNTSIWFDPCCGTGNLIYNLIKNKNIKNKELFLLKNVKCNDIDNLALFTAKILLTINFQKDNKNLFFDIKNNFTNYDILNINNLKKIDYDYSILNPPYLAVKENTNFISKKTKNLYAYILENIIQTSKGFISITPQSFTNSKNFFNFRELLLKKFNGLKIYCFDIVPGYIFKGYKIGGNNIKSCNNNVRASIMIGKKQKEKSYYITDLLRWNDKERTKMLFNVNKKLVETNLSKDIFYKNGNFILQNFFNNIKKNKKIKDIITTKETKFYLYIPTTPRYFITGTEKELKRSSIKKLFFNNKRDLEYVFLLINSSYMYWYWRIADGGMSLSLETIKNLPLLDNYIYHNGKGYNSFQNIKDKLKKSEKENLIITLNGNKKNENIKHNFLLIKELNKILINDKDIIKEMEFYHKNNYFL